MQVQQEMQERRLLDWHDGCAARIKAPATVPALVSDPHWWTPPRNCLALSAIGASLPLLLESYKKQRQDEQRIHSTSARRTCLFVRPVNRYSSEFSSSLIISFVISEN